MSDTNLRDYLDGGVIWDNHACMPLDVRCPQMHDLERCREAGIDVISLNVSSGDQTAADALQMLRAFHEWLAENSEHYLPISSASDVALARNSRKLGICFDIEGMSVLEGNEELVQVYYDLGVRWMLTAYNHRNAIGGGCLDQHDAGLTSFGRKVVAKMNEVGMVVCGSHAGDRTARELIDESSAPIIFSHSNPRSIWNSRRNIPDDIMVACAKRGGVIGLNGIGAFLGPNDNRIETYVQHIAYAVDLVGEDHVGVALDYCFGQEDDMIDFIRSVPDLFLPEHGYLTDGLRMIAPWRLFEVARCLRDNGFGEATIAKLFGGNHLRIARSVWK